MYYLSPPTRRQLRSSTLRRSRLFTSSLLAATVNQSRNCTAALHGSPRPDSVHSVSPHRLNISSSESSASSCSVCDRDGAFFSASMLADPRNQSITIDMSDQPAEEEEEKQMTEKQVQTSQQGSMHDEDDSIADVSPKPRQSRIDALDLGDAALPKSIQVALTASRVSGSKIGARFNDYQERLLVLELLRAEEMDALAMESLNADDACYRDAGSESSRLARVIRSLQSTVVRARKPHTLYEHYSSRPTRLFPGDASEIHTGVLIPLNAVWPSLVPRIRLQQLSLWLLLETDPSVTGVGMLVQSSLFLSNEVSNHKNCLEPLYCDQLGYETGGVHHKTVTALKQHIKEIDKMAKEYEKALELANESELMNAAVAEVVADDNDNDDEERKEASRVQTRKRARRSSRGDDRSSKKKRVLEPLQWEYFNETVQDRFESSPLFG